MIEFKIKPLLDVQDVLATWSMVIHNRPADSGPVRREQRDTLTEQIKPLMEQLDTDEFKLCKRGAERLIETLDKHGDSVRIASAVDDLRRRLLDQAELTSCLSLSQKEKELYQPPRPLFGQDFDGKFLTAGSFELEEAAKCLALSRPTAGVFHLMRLMEIGVAAVARCLGIPDPTKPRDRNWGFILGEIKKDLDARSGTATSPPTKSWVDSADRALFESAYGSLDAVRVAWRNPTMHVENKYMPNEAEHVFVAVRGFMTKLASRCDENGDPKA